MELPGPETWKRINDVLAAALERAPGERDAFLSEACAGDAALRRRVERLLRADRTAGDLLEETAVDFACPLLLPEGHGEPPSAPLPEGKKVGPYRIASVLGEGGTSTVYRAERADGQFERTVAVKVLRDAVIAAEDLHRRFEAEQQILASLAHPNVARVFDGGVLEQSERPYLVMEYVEGRPITAHCEKYRLDLEARMDLFDRVAEAVQHAHQNMIVHRDLKPSNILVTPEGTPKLLDFGIAKLLGEATADDAPRTRTGALMMTPAYAAPEQVRGDDVIAATDTYALGVLLYELLAGARPHDVEGQSPLEVARVVCEETPPRPSTAARRRLGEEERPPRAWRPQPEVLRGDLDAIVRRALRKEPERRYTSVEAMRDDLGRHCAGRPVAARQGTWRYRAGKFARRHRWQIAAAGAFVLLLVTYAATVTFQSRRLAAERDRAAANAERARSSAAFLKEVLSIPDPEEGQGGAVPARVLLQKGAARLDTGFADQPLLKADLKEVIGSAFREYGLYEKALGLHRDALALRKGTGAGGDSARLALADTRNNIGEALYYLDRPDSARAQYRRSLSTRRRLRENRHADVAQSLNNLALLDAGREDYARAAKRMEEALAIFRENLPADHWRVANALSNLATMHSRRGAMAEAEQKYREALAMQRRVKGATNAGTVRIQANLGSVLMRSEKHAEAKETFRQALRQARASTTESLPLEAYVLYELGELHRRQGRLAEAEQRYREARERYREALPPDHSSHMGSLIGLGEVLLAQGRAAEALSRARRATKIGEAALPSDHRVLASARALLGAVLTNQGRHEEAERALRAAHDALPLPKTPAEKRALRRTRERLARLYETWGRPEQARRYRRALERQRG
jgi:serine/threonine-protein kinase